MENFHSSVSEFGEIDGKKVNKYLIGNGYLTAVFLNYGATLITFSSPDKQGNVEELTMNRTTLDDIVHKSDYFGSTIGRNAFRIANGQFTLNGTHYQLATNSGSNHNHGGVVGFDKCLWDAEITTHTDRVSITFSRYSADKEEGYPGSLRVKVTYSITSSNELDMVFEATGNEIPTIVNMTNHAYWNLSGSCKRPVNNHKLFIASDFYLDGENMIPNETPIPVKDTLMDFTTLKALSPAIDRVDGGGKPGIDHAFCLRDYSNDIDHKTLRNVARLVEEESGRCIDIATTECALIVYTSNWVDEEPPFAPHYAICLEPGFYPDTPNHPSFPTSVILPGHSYYHHSVFKFSTLFCVCFLTPIFGIPLV